MPLPGRACRPRFNSRSRMGSDCGVIDHLPPKPGFNSRSRMGSDTAPSTAKGGGHVSIHAPAWGATSARPSPLATAPFQFTLPHGERLVALRKGAPAVQFQFTLPHGERRSGLPRGAVHNLFQFTLPHGERLSSADEGVDGGGFQFTLPHGERHA